MRISTVTGMLLTLLMGSTITATLWAGNKLPAVNEEGMQLVEDSKLATVYADPGADLGAYKRIWLEDATVAFKKNWQRDRNRVSRTNKVDEKNMNRIKRDVSELFREVMTRELEKSGYQLTDKAELDVLKVRPAIVDLDVISPDLRSAGASSSYSESAGEMTLKLDLFDSVTNDKIATAIDRKRDYRRGYLQYRSSVSNRADARRMMAAWAKAFRKSLDAARKSASSSD